MVPGVQSRTEYCLVYSIVLSATWCRIRYCVRPGVQCGAEYIVQYIVVQVATW